MHRNSLNMKEIYQMAIFGEFQVIKFQANSIFGTRRHVGTYWVELAFRKTCILTQNVVINRLRGTSIHQNIQAEI